jgi:hypothetical protein
VEWEKGPDQLIGNDRITVWDAVSTDWLPYHDPPKEKRLREWWVEEASGDRVYGWWRRGPLAGKPSIYEVVQYREVSPERDEIVRAAVAMVEMIRPACYSVPGIAQERCLLNAVEAWEKAGRPS